MKIVSVDPSLRNFGIVVADLDIDTMKFKIADMRLVESEDNAKKAKTVRKNSDDLRRAKLLHDGFVEACKGANMAFVEVPVGSQSARAMASYGICIGVLAACPIPMIQLTPTEVKLAMTGEKTATKDEMIQAAVKAHPYARWMTRKVRGELTLLSSNEHLADAVGAIAAGIQTNEFKGMVSMMRSLKSA
jgi:Holliday junction resolvasome RuvABC endonuclease subunit